MADIVQGYAERHHRLTLVRPMDERSPDGHRLALWRCDCGQEKAINASRVRRGLTRSCGCLMIEASRETNTTHGHRQRRSREYSTWNAMRGRCLNPSHKDFPRYGAKGITVCEEWAGSFEAFLAHVGPRPPGTTLDRIKAELGYRPGNVRWATPLVQARNRPDFKLLRTPHGVMAVADYASLIGITPGAAYQRLKRGKLEGVTRA